MKRKSIRMRLMLLMILLATLPVLIVTLIATVNTRNSVEEEIINANLSRIEWSEQYLNELIEQIDILFYSLQINQELVSGLDDTDNPDVSVQYRSLNHIREALSSQFYTNSRKIDELTLYMHESQKAITVDFANNGTVYPLTIDDTAWKRLLREPINIYFKQTNEGIYAYHSINRFEDRMLLGGIGVRINRDVWQQVSHILQSEAESTVFLLNDEGETLSGSTVSEQTDDIRALLTDQMLSGNDEPYIVEGGYFFFIKIIAGGQLTIVKAIPFSTVSESARPTIVAGALIGGFFVLLSLLLSVLFSLRITRPIIGLAKSMRHAHVSNFEQHSIQSQDEIGLLERGYNAMMGRIKELIEVEYQQEIEVKKAQLLALQAQINPHFLHNTLQLIGGMALSVNAVKIHEITLVVGDLLRYSISTDGELVKLDEELRHMRNYIFIQENRFYGRCQVGMDVDEQVLASQLPRFTLQPIVENAFEYGLQPKRGSWHLFIRMKRIRNRCVFIVVDQGIGIVPERLEEIRDRLKGRITLNAGQQQSAGTGRRKGVGLHNVNARMVLQFGDKHRMRVFSKAGEGTMIVISWPYVNTGEELGGNAESVDRG